MTRQAEFGKLVQRGKALPEHCRLLYIECPTDATQRWVFQGDTPTALSYQEAFVTITNLESEVAEQAIEVEKEMEATKVKLAEIAALKQKPPTRVRVLRLIEYIYNSLETAEDDMAGWSLSPDAVLRPSPSKTIRSVTLPPMTISAEEADVEIQSHL